MSAKVIQLMGAGRSTCVDHSVRAASLTERAWKESDGSTEDASLRLYNLALNDEDFIASYLNTILRTWARDQIGSHVGAIRVKAWRPPNVDVSQHGDRLRQAVEATLHDFLLPGGKRLGDATPHECLAAAEFYGDAARDYSHKSRWLRGVADAAGGALRIADALTEDQLRKIQEQTHAA